MIPLASLLLLAPAPTPPPTAPALGVDLGDQISLEQLLERYRSERDSLLDTYRGRVEALVVDLEAAFGKAAGDRKRDLEKCRRELSGLVPEALPLLVRYVDPGVAAEDEIKARSRQVARELAELASTRSVTGELLEMLQKGSIEGRRNALQVLGSSDDVERVGPVLREMYESGEVARRGELLAAIARLGGAENDAFIAAILADKDPKIVGLALDVLTDSRIESGAGRILELVRAPENAAPHLKGILDYYRACPEVLDDDHSTALAGLARALVNNPGDAVAVLELLTEFQDRWGSKIKREFRQLSDSPDRRISQAALIGLARAGDRSAKKKLLDPYDDRVQRNPQLAQAWEERADLRYKIGDFKNAIKDYQEAIRTGEAYGRSQPDVYVGTARCYAQLRKLKDAADWLEKAPLSIVMLRSLAMEPVFRELVEHPKYRKVFHLKED